MTDPTVVTVFQEIPDGQERTLTISELTTLLIKHYGIKEGIYEASFGMGIIAGGFTPMPDAKIFPGIAMFVQNVSLQPVAVPTPHSVDASKLD